MTSKHWKDQPRHPAGSSQGGQWSSMGASMAEGAGVAEKKTVYDKWMGGDMIDKTRNPWEGISTSYITEFDDGSRALIKSFDPDVGPGSIDTEEFAYDLSEALGVGLVGETFADSQAQLSVHEFIEGNGIETFAEHIIGRINKGVKHNYTATEIEGMRGELEQFGSLMLLDLLLNNQDRHWNNLLVDADGKIHAIDHGRSNLNTNSFNFDLKSFVTEHMSVIKKSWDLMGTMYDNDFGFVANMWDNDISTLKRMPISQDVADNFSIYSLPDPPDSWGDMENQLYWLRADIIKRNFFKLFDAVEY